MVKGNVTSTLQDSHYIPAPWLHRALDFGPVCRAFEAWLADPLRWEAPRAAFGSRGQARAEVATAMDLRDASASAWGRPHADQTNGR